MALAGKTFTFGSKSSTSGRLMPEHFIRMNTGKSPAEFLGSEPRFSNSHDLTCEQVEKGVLQAGAFSYATYDLRVKEGQTGPDVCRRLTSISLATICASVVLPSPGGPKIST